MPSRSRSMSSASEAMPRKVMLLVLARRRVAWPLRFGFLALSGALSPTDPSPVQSGHKAPPTTNPSLHDPDPRPIGQCHFPVDDRRAVEAVVLDQHRAIEVSPIDERGKLRGGGNRARGLGHAAEHGFQAERTRQQDHFVRFAQPRAFHQLDVHAVECPRAFLHVGQSLAAFRTKS